MKGLSDYNPIWEDARTKNSSAHIYEDEDILIATDFEGGNGTDIERLGQDRYFMRLEPEPGNHRYSGKSGYISFGVRSKRPETVSAKIRTEANCWGTEVWNTQTHAVLRRAGHWSQLDPGLVYPVEATTDILEIALPLPGTQESDNTLFVSNYHWWPSSECNEYLRSLEGVELKEIARSYQNRPIYAVEMGNRNGQVLVHSSTPQAGEMGSLACRALIDFLCAGSNVADDILGRFRVCFLPDTNPDGNVLGHCNSDGQGGFPYFEGYLAAEGNASASPENKAVWHYLEQKRPVLFWEWHSNHLARRPGHMLLRYRPELIENEPLREKWEEIERRLQELPDTMSAGFTSHNEGPFQGSMGFQASTRLGSIACMIKQHDKFPLAKSREHAIECLKAAAAVL